MRSLGALSFVNPAGDSVTSGTSELSCTHPGGEPCNQNEINVQKLSNVHATLGFLPIDQASLDTNEGSTCSLVENMRRSEE